MFLRTVIRQGNKIIELDKENSKICNEIADLRTDKEELIKLLVTYRKLSENAISDLYKLQDINTLGIKEEDKNLHRNVLINHIINTFNKINSEMSK